jgi:hypothetical protein
MVMTEYWKRAGEAIYKHYLNRFTTVSEVLKHISFVENILLFLYLTYEFIPLHGEKMKCKIYKRIFECDTVSEAPTYELTTLRVDGGCE